MKIQIYHSTNYIPFDLYIYSLYNIFQTNVFFTNNSYEVSVINNINNYSSESDYLILFLNYVSDIYYLNTNKTKIILIHADYIINHSLDNQEIIKKYVNTINKENSYIWDYNILNINYYNEHYINKNFYMIPLQYNEFLEILYNNYKLNIPHNEKPIDVLFIGSPDPGSRRFWLTDKISKKHNLHVMTNINSIDAYINIVEKSKIVINIYSSEMNKPFDHYRLALLYSNKIFVITEEFDSFDKNLEEIIIKTDYDNILNLVSEYLNKSEESIQIIKEKTYETYKKNDMSTNIVNFFKSV